MTVSVTSSCCEGRELTQVREEILVSRSGSVLWSVLSVQFSVSAHQSDLLSVSAFYRPGTVRHSERDSDLSQSSILSDTSENTMGHTRFPIVEVGIFSFLVIS